MANLLDRERAEPEPAPGGQRRKLMAVLDDETAMADLLCEYFRAQGFDVIGEADKRKFLDDLPGLKVDLIISDLNSPGLNGIEMLKQLKLQSGLPHIPVIITSGFAGEEVTRTVLDLGAFACFRKPYEIEQLMAAVNEALETRPRSSGAGGSPPSVMTD